MKYSKLVDILRTDFGIHNSKAWLIVKKVVEQDREFVKEILDEIKKEIKRLDMEASKHCFKKGKMCDECWNKKQPLMKIISKIEQKTGELE